MIEHFLKDSDSQTENNVLNINEYYVGVRARLVSVVPPVVQCIVNDELFRSDSTFQLQPITDIELINVGHSLKDA